MAMTEHELVNRISVLKIEHSILKSEWVLFRDINTHEIESLETQAILDMIEKYKQQLKSHSDII